MHCKIFTACIFSDKVLDANKDSIDIRVKAY